MLIGETSPPFQKGESPCKTICEIGLVLVSPSKNSVILRISIR